MRGIYITAAFILLVIPVCAQDFDKNDRIFKVLKPISAIKFVASGEKTKINYAFFLNPDCSSSGNIQSRIVKKPKNGEITGINESKYSTFDDKNIRHHCNTGMSPSFSLYYKSNEKFVGGDSAEVLFIYPEGSADLTTYELIVR